MAEREDIAKIVCRSCFAVLDAGDNFCRRCGAATGSAVGQVPPARSGSDMPVRATLVGPPGVAGRKWSESPQFILLLLFFVLGPLALPMLWRSPRFSRLWKFLLTTMITALTVLILVLIWYVLDKSLEPLRELKHMPGFAVQCRWDFAA